jgi:CMP-N-acetylneuraminic acid synthetase
MIQSENILAVIPARGGSKGVTKKNIRKLGGKPLIAYTIQAALGSRYIKRFIVSTDDKEIAEISNKWGADVPYLRPPDLATDTTKAITVVKHALLEMEKIDNKEYSVIVYLEPPAPFKTSEDIDASIKLFFKHNPASVVSVNEANQFHPILMKKIVDNRLKPIWKNEPEGVPRQMYKPTNYMRNGAVYILKKENILNNIFYGDPILPYIMPDDRSICIDSMLDWYTAEAMIRSKTEEKQDL